MTETRKLRVFLSHGNYDKPVVHRLYERLIREEWIDPWLDEVNLLPGQDRTSELDKVLKSTDVALICLSKQSLEQEGSFQREIRSVVDIAKEKPESSIFIIPIRLNDCDMPQPLHAMQYVDLFASAEDKEHAYLRIRRSMEIKLELVSGKTKESHSIHWVSSISSKDTVDDLLDLSFGGFTFVKIPKGKFKMGSRASNDLSGDDEHPQWRYDIPYNYWMTRFPVSNEQFSEYAVSTRHSDALPKDWKKKLDQPLVNVSWREAVDYTNWLNQIFRNEITNGLVFRLPTEAEWEKASRGDGGREWPWGNENLDQLLNKIKPEIFMGLKKRALDENVHVDNFGDYLASASRPKPSDVENDPVTLPFDMLKMKIAELRRTMELIDVGSFSPIMDSQYEIADMMGTVWEWTHSLYKPYPYDVKDGREDPEQDVGERVVRGCFLSRGERLSVRCAKRGCTLPNRKEPYLGFRIVVAPPIS